jgi:predicted dehydrogenase
MNSSTTPRIALIGFGRWGRNIGRVLSRLGALKLVVDPAADVLEEQVRALGSEITSDLERAFTADIDAVAIAAPAVDHAWLARRALENGKPAFVEKPLAFEVSDAQMLAELARNRGLPIMVGHLLQYHPAFVQLKSMVAAGEIGDLRHVTSNRLNPGAIRTEENALWSMGPHDFSMVLGLASALPTQVSALPVRVVNPAIPDQYHVSLRFADGMTAQINVSWLSPFKEHKLTVLGTTGAVVFDDTAGDRDRKLVVYRDYVDTAGSAPRFNKGGGEPVAWPDLEPLETEMRAFLTAVRGEAGNCTGPEEAIPVLELLHRAQAASVQG